MKSGGLQRRKTRGKRTKRVNKETLQTQSLIIYEEPLISRRTSGSVAEFPADEDVESGREKEEVAEGEDGPTADGATGQNEEKACEGSRRRRNRENRWASWSSWVSGNSSATAEDFGKEKESTFNRRMEMSDWRMLMRDAARAESAARMSREAIRPLNSQNTSYLNLSWRAKRRRGAKNNKLLYPLSLALHFHGSMWIEASSRLRNPFRLYFLFKYDLPVGNVHMIDWKEGVRGTKFKIKIC